MVESLFIAAKKRWGKPTQRVVEWLCAGRQSGACMAILVMVLAVSRFLWVQHQRHRCDEIAEAFGSVGYFYGPPQLSNQGDKIAYLQTTTNGVGVWVCDMTTGQRQIAYEELGKNKIANLDLAVWPWSPDGKFLAYSKKNNVFLWRNDTAENLPKINLGKAPKGIVWLTSDKFVSVVDPGELFLVGKEMDGKWKSTRIADIKVGAASLTALSSNSIAWNQGGLIWCLDLDSKAVRVLFQAPQNQIIDTFSASKDGKYFLVKGIQWHQATLWQMSINRETAKIADCSPAIKKIDWLNATNGSYAFVTPKAMNSFDHVLVIQPKSASGNNLLSALRTASNFAIAQDGSQIIFTGVVSNEPAESIWNYHVSSGKLERIVPCSAHPSSLARHVEPIHGTLKLTSGRLVHYLLYAPVNFNRRSADKYPLVIGDTQLSNPENQDRLLGPLWAESLACCDAYVVIINRASWFKQLDEWEENVLEVFKHLSLNSTIDTKRIFLFGASAETSPLSQLVQKQPELWRGVLLLNPSAMPDLNELPANKSAPNILVSAGDQEHEEDRLKRYQVSAMNCGVLVNFVLHTNSTHWLVSIDSMQERTKAIVDFIEAN